MADDWVIVDRSDWEADAVEYRALTVSAAEIVELRSLARSPPEAVKDVFHALLIALGHANPTWRDAVAWLNSDSAARLAARLRTFDPQTRMTLAKTRTMTP
jgi:hypothetical protein